jgi:hypothetical protein
MIFYPKNGILREENNNEIIRNTITCTLFTMPT